MFVGCLWCLWCLWIRLCFAVKNLGHRECVAVNSRKLTEKVKRDPSAISFFITQRESV